MSQIMCGLLGMCAWEDIRKKKVKMSLLAAVGAVAIAARLLEGWQNGENLVGQMALGILFLVLAACTKAVGAADGVLICATGIFLGFYDNLLLVASAVFGAAVYALILIIWKKKSRKYEIPFIPFLFLAYLWVVLYGD